MKDSTPPKCPLCGGVTQKMPEKRIPDAFPMEATGDVVRVAFFAYSCGLCRATWYEHLDGTPLTRRAETRH